MNRTSLSQILVICFFVPQLSLFSIAGAMEEPVATKPIPLENRPEAPRLLHPVHEVDVTRNPDGSILRTAPQYYQSLRPTIPAVRTSHDGRLGFNWSNSTLYLLSPEKIASPFPFSEPGVSILTSLDGWYSHWQYFLSKPSDPSNANFAGGTLCNHVSRAEQPRKCGNNDCYDVTYVGFRTFISPENSHKVWDKAYFRSRKMVVEVENPKTPYAKVRDIRPAANSEVHENPVPIEVDYSTVDRGFSAFEPLTTTDGRLYVSRVSFVPIKNIDGPNSIGRKDVDIFYMVAPLDAEPCDAARFSFIKRIQRAPSDPDMKYPGTQRARYGIAEYPMRDSFGNLIPEDALFPTYPWLDREGNNLFFTSGGSNLYSYDWKFNKVPTLEPERNETQIQRLANSARYPARCIQGVPNCEESPYNPESSEHIRGFAVLGSWTHGKTIVLDGMINHLDYGLRRGLQFQREIQLYQPAGDFDGWVRAAAGRDTGPGGSGIDNQLESYSENSEIKGLSQTSNVIDSLENIFGTYKNLRPTLPRDIVWTVNNSLSSEEVAFDDYMDTRALIISSMIAGAEFKSGPGNARYDYWRYRDGFEEIFDAIPDKQNRAILIQNGATSQTLPIPTFGYLTSGRVEPVALGGIHGRGLWLNGTNSLNYKFPRPVTNTELFFSIFFDNRSLDLKPRQLAVFPNGTRLLVNTSSVQFKMGAESYNLDISSTKNWWTQLGIAVAANGKSFSIFVNGMKKQTFTTKKSFWGLFNDGKTPVVLKIGKKGANDSIPGFRGWIDEVKLFTYIPTSEVICNHAYGSLYWVKENAVKYWQDVANAIAPTIHQEIYSQLPSSYVSENNLPQNAKFVCATDFHDHMGIYRSLMHGQEGLLSMREVLLFANPRNDGGRDDGRLTWNANRADFRGNAFCLSCHTAAERRGLTLAALEPGNKCTILDRRRQPLQSPLYLAGQLTEDQLRAIDPNHGSLKKYYDPSFGALLTDPLLLKTQTGQNTCGF